MSNNFRWAVGRIIKVFIIFPFVFMALLYHTIVDFAIELAQLPQEIGEGLDCLETTDNAAS